MRWRAVFALLGATVLGAASAASAQTSVKPRIGFLSSRAADETAEHAAAFRQGLSETGFVEGKTVEITYRWAEGRYEELPALAADLVRQKAALIFASGGPPAALAAKAATQTIPIVFSAANDPVRLGLVASLGHPGGNITGMGTLTTPLTGKHFELLRELVPTATVMGFVMNPSNPSAHMVATEALAAARALGIRLHVLNASTEDQLDESFASLAKLGIEALAVTGEPFLDSQRERVAALAARSGVPAIYAWRQSVTAGGLISYGTSLSASYRQAGIYAGRILKGEKPADLPVMEPAKFELVINLKAANALGLHVPATLIERADEVIE